MIGVFEYGRVCPGNSTLVWLILPTVSSVMQRTGGRMRRTIFTNLRKIFLETIGKHFRKQILEEKDFLHCHLNCPLS